MPHATVVELVDEVLRRRREDLLVQVRSWFSDLETEIESRLLELELDLGECKVSSAPTAPAPSSERADAPGRQSLSDRESVQALPSTTYQIAKSMGSRLDFRKKLQIKKRSSEARQGCSTLSRARAAVTALVNTHSFDIFFAMVIISNAIYLGIQVESIDPTTPPGPQPATLAVHLTYAIIFSFEVVLRFTAAGPRQYVCGLDWAWNWLDMSVVFSSWTVIALDFLYEDAADTGVSSSIRIVRIIRASRLLRILRTVWVIRFVGALRTLVSSLVDTLRSLFWALLLLFLIMYVFGFLYAIQKDSFPCGAVVQKVKGQDQVPQHGPKGPS